MNKYSARKFIPLITALLLLLACALPALPTLPSASNPTIAPGSLETIVVATAGAAQTQTARALPPSTFTPTATLPPTEIPTETPTATATVIFIFPTKTYTPTATQPPTETSSVGSDCELVSQSPTNDTVLGSRERFTAEWRLRNTSGDTWSSSSIDFRYSSGRDMHDTDILDLPRNVRPDNEITLSVDMRAPGNAGSYTSTWVLASNKNVLCTVSVRIVVR